MPVERPWVTVFTLARHTRFLDECLLALVDQTFKDWSWVVVLHQGVRWRPAQEDPRIQIVIEDGLVGEGALKRLACSLALGEILVELGQGDLLSSSALEELVAAFESHPEVGFVYANGARILEDGSADLQPPDLRQGWSSQEVVVDDLLVLMIEAMAPTPHNVSYSWSAPRHGRAFRRSTYELAGGYDASQDTLVDQDLMCRMYRHTTFHQLESCLYLERLDQRVGRDAQSGPEVMGFYDRYIEPNALAWARRRGLMAFDLGTADQKPPGYVRIDRSEGPGVDIVADLGAGIDLPDSSAGVIRAVDFLERAPDKIAVFNELYRLLAHGGMLLTLTASTDGRGAFQDPTHVAYYNENSFWYFTDNDYAHFVPQISCRFQVSKLTTFFPSEWHEQHKIPYVGANLIAIKDGPRQGGPLNV